MATCYPLRDNAWRHMRRVEMSLRVDQRGVEGLDEGFCFLLDVAVWHEWILAECQVSITEKVLNQCL